MKKNKKLDENEDTITVPLSSDTLPLESLKDLINNNLITEELPFDLIAKEYPSLLSDWYPGFPNEPRLMNPEDPIPTIGYIKNGTVTFKEMPGLENEQISLGDCENNELEGEYTIWLKKESDGNWNIIVQAEK